MKNFLFVGLTLILGISGASAQMDGGAPQGYASAALAGGDLWSAYYNQAGLAQIKGVSAGVFYNNAFMIPELGTGGAVVAVPLGKQVLAGSIRSFGYSLYNEGKYSLAYARILGENVRVGVQFNAQTVRIGEGYGRKSVFTVEGGLSYDAGKHVTLSAHVYNPNQARLHTYEDERLPALLRAGARYTFSEKLFLEADVWKPVNHDPQLRIGTEYWIHELIALRAGVSTGAFQSYFGAGVKLGKFELDISSAYHSVLGFSPQLALAYHGK
ncbi:MAG: hypothetical protein KDC12_07270 [Flavobacteriales bacterium]|nr:hypothetical protein [Flavobacteriales bacterium]